MCVWCPMCCVFLSSWTLNVARIISGRFSFVKTLKVARIILAVFFFIQLNVKRRAKGVSATVKQQLLSDIT